MAAFPLLLCWNCKSRTALRCTALLCHAGTSNMKKERVVEERGGERDVEKGCCILLSPSHSHPPKTCISVCRKFIVLSCPVMSWCSPEDKAMLCAFLPIRSFTGTFRSWIVFVNAFRRQIWFLYSLLPSFLYSYLRQLLTVVLSESIITHL